MDIPFSGDDLISIGKAVNNVTEKLDRFLDEKNYDGLIDYVHDVKVEILRPDGGVVGEVRWHPDGWFGFYPKGVSE